MKDPKVIATIRNKDIPDDMKEQAIKEARQIAKLKPEGFNNVETIMGFAIWGKTPSGLDFWSKINRAAEKQSPQEREK